MDVNKYNGYKFLDFLFIKESEMHNYHRLAGSYAVIKCDEKYLLCYNTLRKQWELPAGRREENESPIDCAIRELYEERGQNVSDMDFKRLLRVMNVATSEVKYNPIYFTTLDQLQPFQENEETSDIYLWDLKSQVGYIDEVDIKIFDYL